MMINVQDIIENRHLFRKFKVDELLFAEIKCPVEDDEPVSSFWWHDHFFAFAMAGEMVLKTIEDEYIFKTGDCIFVKKGSMISARHKTQEEFCELRVFIPDSFIKTVFQKYRIPTLASQTLSKTDTIIPLAEDEVLPAYFHSLLPHFSKVKPPAKALLKLKFEELLVNVLSAPRHRSLHCYLSEISYRGQPSIPEIMEANFIKNLKLREFARLCGRSLTAFKVDFKKTYHTSPGKWLRNKRLEYSCYVLKNSDMHVDEVCYTCGFENRSHFSRVFRQKYGLSPRQFKLKNNYVSR